MIKDCLQRAVMLYAILAVLLIVYKPAGMFDEQGRAKAFGFGPDRTLFTFGHTIIIGGVLAYFFCVVTQV